MAGITSSLNTALSGLATSQQQIGVVGNNIANVDTVGFKASSLDFKTQFLQNFSFGSAPTGNLGGTNPLQIGLGATSGAVTKNFADGSLEATGVNTNLAIQGNGFFVLRQGTQQVYTRDGSFQLNGQNDLVSGTGQLVQGYTVDNNYNIVPGTLTTLTIPVGQASVAQATSNVNIAGQLDANGPLPTQPAQLNTVYYQATAPGVVDPTNPPTGATLLTALSDSSGNLLYQNNDVIQLSVTEGTAPSNAASATTRTITESFTVTPTSTLTDLTNFLTGAMGINTSTIPPANGAILPAPGISIAAGPGGGGTNPPTNSAVVSVVGNLGTGSDITLDQNSLTVKRAGTTINETQNWTKTAAADGESVYTTTNVFDSLGNTLNLNIVASLVSKTSTGTTWQVYANSPDGSGTGAQLNNVIGLGTLTFDGNGNLLASTTPSVTINRQNTGAIPNLQFKINFSGVQAQGPTNGVTQDNSQLNATADGAIPGVLKTFSIGPDGRITGAFSNGLNRTVGQVVLATFQNNEGLVDQGGNTYVAGPNSGNAIITDPGALSAGTVTSGSLEGSNVDLSTEFVKLIAASTAFSASSRVITSSNQLLQDLLSAAR